VVTDRTFDISRAEEEIGYHPAVSLEDGIRETIGWYKANHRI
jgi:nucleoside-diphosphate-sugar epimerase